jgi:hypothetical protein
MCTVPSATILRVVALRRGGYAADVSSWKTWNGTENFLQQWNRGITILFSKEGGTQYIAHMQRSLWNKLMHDMIRFIASRVYGSTLVVNASIAIVLDSLFVQSGNAITPANRTNSYYMTFF